MTKYHAEQQFQTTHQFRTQSREKSPMTEQMRTQSREKRSSSRFRTQSREKPWTTKQMHMQSREKRSSSQERFCLFKKYEMTFIKLSNIEKRNKSCLFKPTPKWKKSQQARLRKLVLLESQIQQLAEPSSLYWRL
jgi:hypothetical protein